MKSWLLSIQYMNTLFVSLVFFSMNLWIGDAEHSSEIEGNGELKDNYWSYFSHINNNVNLTLIHHSNYKRLCLDI
jgi:hypothetical protein